VPFRESERGRRAFRLCRGFGLEIGALHDPFDLDAAVLRLDRMDREGLRRWYGDDPRAARIRRVHVVAARPPYGFFCDGAFDFVVSSHVLEHMPNPGLAVEEWLRVTRPGGVVFAVLPNRERTFDRPRATTPPQKMLAAWEARDPEAPLEQYRDYCLNKELEAHETRRKTEDEIRALHAAQESVHIYTWTPDSARGFFAALAPRLGARLELLEATGIDIFVALRKEGEGEAEPDDGAFWARQRRRADRLRRRVRRRLKMALGTWEGG
jgi:SAM-dependent methyltransferase